MRIASAVPRRPSVAPMALTISRWWIVVSSSFTATAPTHGAEVADHLRRGDVDVGGVAHRVGARAQGRGDLLEDRHELDEQRVDLHAQWQRTGQPSGAVAEPLGTAVVRGDRQTGDGDQLAHLTTTWCRKPRNSERSLSWKDCTASPMPPAVAQVDGEEHDLVDGHHAVDVGDDGLQRGGGQRRLPRPPVAVGRSVQRARGTGAAAPSPRPRPPSSTGRASGRTRAATLTPT